MVISIVIMNGIHRKTPNQLHTFCEVYHGSVNIREKLIIINNR